MKYYTVFLLATCLFCNNLSSQDGSRFHGIYGGGLGLSMSSNDAKTLGGELLITLSANPRIGFNLKDYLILGIDLNYVLTTDDFGATDANSNQLFISNLFLKAVHNIGLFLEFGIGLGFGVSRYSYSYFSASDTNYFIKDIFLGPGYDIPLNDHLILSPKVIYTRYAFSSSEWNKPSIGNDLSIMIGLLGRF